MERLESLQGSEKVFLISFFVMLMNQPIVNIA